MRFGSLFSGIGGLDLGLERAGHECAWQSEIDPFCCEVLARHWPDVPNLGDVTKIEWEDVERVDLICGGFPCQPFSFAGKRKGEADDRHLWPYFFDAIRVLRPRFALLENVPGHLSLGFGRVLGDLAEVGYDAEWDCIPASAMRAPHRRDRLFVVAHSHHAGPQGLRAERELGQGRVEVEVGRSGAGTGTGTLADSRSTRCTVVEEDPARCGVAGAGQERVLPLAHAVKASSPEADSEMERGGQLNPQWVEWLMGFPAGWTDLEHSGTP